MRDLYPFQVEALENIRLSYSQGVRRLVLQAPTGAGKTMIGAAIVAGAQRKKRKVCFLVTRKALIDQTVEKFAAEGIYDIGVIQADHHMTDWSKPVQIASVQTIRSRGKYPEADLFIIDECHELHKEHIKLLTDPKMKDTFILGLSATPWTKGLGKYFESLMVVATTQELIDQKFLSPFRVFAADHPNLDGVKIVAGDYHEGQLSTVMQESGLTANIVETWKERWGKDKTLCFCVDRAHAQAMQERFQDAGIPCGYQDALTPGPERRQIEKDFRSGALKVVANIGTLTTGVDWPVKCLILARPTKSEILFVQIIGRALRTAPDKDHAIILDHSDTTARLGFVTDIHHEHLDDGKQRKKAKASVKDEALPKPCQQCKMLLQPGVKVCPSCGLERKVQSKVFEKDGELQEFTVGGGRTRASQFNPSMTEKAAFYAQLKGYAKIKGYADGWAGHKYREKFKGAWPEWSIKGVPPMEPGAEVLNYIKSRQIAWIKSKHRQPLKPLPLLGENG